MLAQPADRLQATAAQGTVSKPSYDAVAHELMGWMDRARLAEVALATLRMENAEQVKALRQIVETYQHSNECVGRVEDEMLDIAEDALASTNVPQPATEDK